MKNKVNIRKCIIVMDDDNGFYRSNETPEIDGVIANCGFLYDPESGNAERPKYMIDVNGSQVSINLENYCLIPKSMVTTDQKAKIAHSLGLPIDTIIRAFKNSENDSLKDFEQ